MFELVENIPQNAVIKVIGVGGGGGNAVHHMISNQVDGVEFICANTDAQALNNLNAKTILQMGSGITKGLGAGANPAVGRQAALEDRDEIAEILSGADMVFITAGMGGGTGTGASPVVAKLAKDAGALTVAIVTKPFTFEANRRISQADFGIQELAKEVDSLIVIPNDKLNEIQQISGILDSFRAADDVLTNAVRGIADIIVGSGFINVDFADVKKIMKESGGKALMGTGEGEGTSRAIEAAENAITSPLLEDISIEGATGILINVTASSNFTIDELNEACNHIKSKANPNVELIFGLVVNEVLGDKVKITVIATGIDGNSRPHLSTVSVEEEDKNQISLELDNQILEDTNENGVEAAEKSDIDDLHPLGDDEHFEIPAFIRRPKK